MLKTLTRSHCCYNYTHRQKHAAAKFKELCTITSSHVLRCSPFFCSAISWPLILSEDLIRCTNYTKWNFYLEMEKIGDRIRRRARGSQLPNHNENTWRASLVIINKVILSGEGASILGLLRVGEPCSFLWRSFLTGFSWLNYFTDNNS